MTDTTRDTATDLATVETPTSFDAAALVAPTRGAHDERIIRAPAWRYEPLDALTTTRREHSRRFTAALEQHILRRFT